MPRPQLSLLPILKLLFWLTLAFVSDTVEANIDRFTQLTTNNGLSSNQITAITQDQQGYMWLATPQGLNKYDGYDINHYGLPEITIDGQNNAAWSLLVSKSGTLWAGSRQGLNRYNAQTDTFEAVELATDFAVNAMAEDAQGSLWLGTTEGLYRYQPHSNQLSHFTLPANHDKAGNSIWAVYPGKDKNLWLGTAAGLYRLDLVSERIALQPTGLAQSAAILSIGQDLTGRLWLGSDKGAGLLNLTNGQFFKLTLNQDKTGTVTTIWRDNLGNMWLGSLEGLHQVSSQSLQSMHFWRANNNPNSLLSNRIYAIMQDSSGLLWIGTGGGVNTSRTGILPIRRFPHQLNSTGIRHRPAITAIHIDDKHIWLGSKGLGLSLFDPQSTHFEHLEQFSGKDGLSSQTVTALASDRQGHLWVGTINGLNRIKKSTGHVTRFIHNPSDQTSLVSNQIMSISVTSNGQMWVGTQRGLARYQPEQGTFINYSYQKGQKNDLSHPRIVSINEDKNGVLWLGTGGGITRLTPSSGHFEQLRIDQNNTNWFGVNVVLSAHYHPELGLLYGTNGGGLAYYDQHNQHFHHYQQSDGISSQTVLSITSANNFIWLATSRGIDRFDPASRTFANYSLERLMQNAWFEPRAVAHSSDGKIYIGGQNDLFVIDSNKLSTPASTPKLVLTDIDTNNPPGPSGLDLPHGQNHLSLKFALLDYRDPQQNSYRYKLQGFDRQWTQTDATSRTAQYDNLPSGNYEFRLQAKSALGAWWNNEQVIAVAVANPPWFKWWAWLLYLAGLTILVKIMVKWRTRIIANKNRALGQEVQARTREVQLQKQTIEELLEKKETFYANVSHEFRTPLTLILGPLEKGLKDPDTPLNPNQLGLMKRNAYRLLHMVDQLLDLTRYSKTQTAALVPIDLSAMITQMLDSFEPLAQQKGITLRRHPSPHPVSVLFDREALEKVLLNLLSNAIKYNKQGGYVEILLEDSGNTGVKMTVSDNGIGIAAQNHTKIFERFVRDTQNHNERLPGAGIGLSLVKELVELHHGEISLRSAPDQGADFMILFKGAPVSDVDEQQPQAASEMTAITQNNNGQQSKPTLLIIEDNTDLRSYLTAELSGNYHCLNADNGKTGITLALENIPDLIVSDVMMPEVDGFRLTHVLREDIRTCHIPIVLLTARGDKQSRLKGWQEKIDDYVTKPFDIEELQQRLTSLLAVRALLSQRINQLNLSTAPDEIEAEKLGEKDQQFMAKIELIVADNYTNPDFNITQLCKHVGLGDRQLRRKLNALCQLGPTDYLRRYRLEAAKKQLDNSERINIAADNCGFSSPTYFAHCFKKQYGITPSHYQKMPEHKNQV